MRRRDREINIFNIAFLDVITGAMGAFVLMVLILAPYYAGDVTNKQHEKAVTEKLDSAQKAIAQASMTASQSGDPSKVQPALQQASSALGEARQNLDGMRQQLDQLSAQNKRVKAVDDAMQAQVEQMKEQQASLTQQLQSMKSQAGAPPAGSPLIVSMGTSCPNASLKLFVISQYRPGHSFNDPTFDPAQEPKSGSDDASLASMMNGSYDPTTGQRNTDSYAFKQWVIEHGEWRSEVRIFYALVSPLSLSAILPQDYCSMSANVTMKGKAYQILPVDLTSAQPLALAAILTIADDGTISVKRPSPPGINNMTDAERSAANAWLSSTADARDPIQAAAQGRMTDEVRQSLAEGVKRIDNGAWSKTFLFDATNMTAYNKARRLLGLPPTGGQAPSGGSGNGSNFPFGH
jgi:hypothetical protein